MKFEAILVGCDGVLRDMLEIMAGASQWFAHKGGLAAFAGNGLSATTVQVRLAARCLFDGHRAASPVK